MADICHGNQRRNVLIFLSVLYCAAFNLQLFQLTSMLMLLNMEYHINAFVSLTIASEENMCVIRLNLSTEVWRGPSCNPFICHLMTAAVSKLDPPNQKTCF